MALTQEKNVETHKQKISKRLTNWLSSVTVEPVMILYMLPCILGGLTMQNLNLEKACRVNLGLTEETCDGLTSRNTSMYTKDNEIAVQKLVATMFAWKTVLQSLIPAMFLLFLGSWSDRHGRRKPFILLPILGEVITCMGYLICTYFFYELPMEFNGISEALPPAITGGWVTMFMATFSYISGQCSAESRTLRIGAIHILMECSATVGVALSGVLFKAIDFYGVFGICLVAYSLSLIYGYLRINEDATEKFSNDKETHQLGFIKDCFNLKHVKDTFRVAFKNGQNNRKMRVCSIFLLVMVISGPLYGEMGVMYLYVRYRFHWNEVDYSIFSTYKVVIHLLGSMFSLTLFTKFLKFDDSLLGAISTTSKVLSCFVYAFAPSTTVFYLGVLIEFLNGTSHIAMRSIISKLVPADELGKVNSLFGVCEALMPLFYGPMYSMIYKATLKVLPGTFFLVGGLLTFPATLVFLWLYSQHRHDQAEAKKNHFLKEGLLIKQKIQT